MSKTLVLYTFSNFNESVYCFIKHGIFEDENIHFMFICNNMDIDEYIHVDAIIPKYVTFIKRENIGFDFGAWSVGALTNDQYKKYDYLVFLNASVIGPYLPDGCTNKWPNILTSKLNDNVKLVGCTINTMNNIESRSHIQSYCFCMDRTTFKFLVDKEIFSLTNFKQNKVDVVYGNEIPMSRLIIDNGWNISCLCQPFHDIDYTFKTYHPSSLHSRQLYADPPHPCHYNVLWKSSDVMFIKRNRGYNFTDEDKRLLML
jgi:hypothetical protein